MKLNNKYYIMRHGEALSNVKDIVSCWPEKFRNPLTEKGREVVKKSAKELKDRGIDINFIFSSPLLRTRQTADIIGKKFKIKPRFDKRLRELEFGTFNGKDAESFMKYFDKQEERINGKTPGGENYKEVMKRALDFFKEINAKYHGKNILIVTHQCLLLLLQGQVMGYNFKKIVRETYLLGKIKKGEIIELI